MIMDIGPEFFMRKRVNAMKKVWHIYGKNYKQLG